jgi:hypothetical protein
VPFQKSLLDLALLVLVSLGGSSSLILLTARLFILGNITIEVWDWNAVLSHTLLGTANLPLMIVPISG